MFDLPPPDPSLEIAIASQGMSKGLRQTDGPQLIGRGEIAFGPVHAGLLVKNVSSPVADLEAQASIAVRVEAGGFELGGALGYHRQLGDGPSADRGRVEISASVSRPVGALTPRLHAVFSPDDFGAVGRSLYVEGGLSVRILRGAGLSANVGRRERAGGADYTSFNVGATYAPVRWLEADLRYYDTAQSGLGEIYRPRLVAALRLRF